MTELVLAPYVRALAAPAIDLEALRDFAEFHGMIELFDDPATPLGRIAAEKALGAATDADLLSEIAGRFCYRSWGKGRGGEEYLAHAIEERHGSILAHPTVTFAVTGVSRSLSLELIRHHIGTNPSQESQRFVTADGDIEIAGYRASRFVVPPLLLELGLDLSAFLEESERALAAYERTRSDLLARIPAEDTLARKRANEAARCHLPNAIETRLVWTMNLRAARNVVEQRGALGADLEIRRLAVAFVDVLKGIAPRTFADVEVYIAEDGREAVRSAHPKV